MTQKELLYVEDAVKHEESIISFLNDIISNCEEDDDICDFFDNEITIHEEVKGKLLKELEELSK